MHTLHISHNDLDGVGCGILIKKFMPGTINTIYTGYDDIESCITENMHMYDRIIITDVSASYGTVEMLAGEKDVLIIDHHASSERLKDFPFTVHDTSKCATLLTYEYLLENGANIAPYQDFALCVNDVDMWHLKRPDSLRMSMLFNLLGITRFEERFLADAYSGFSESEDLLVTLEEEKRDAYIAKAMRNAETFVDKNGLTASVVFAENYASELGNYIITEAVADYVVIINAQGKKISLRSRKEVDIRTIAESNGGGGHKNAAGFSVKHEGFDLKGILRRVGVTA